MVCTHCLNMHDLRTSGASTNTRELVWISLPCQIVARTKMVQHVWYCQFDSYTMS